MATATLWFGVYPVHFECRTPTAVDRQAPSIEKALTNHLSKYICHIHVHFTWTHLEPQLLGAFFLILTSVRYLNDKSARPPGLSTKTQPDPAISKGEQSEAFLILIFIYSNLIYIYICIYIYLWHIYMYQIYLYMYGIIPVTFYTLQCGL